MKCKKQVTQGLGMKIQTSHQNKEITKKVVATGDSMLNGISKKGHSKFHKVTVENFLVERAIQLQQTSIGC